MTTPQQPQPTVTTEVSWSTNPDAPPAWVDIDATRHSVETITTSVGRSYEQDQAQPGRLVMQLDDSSGDFTPGNTAGAYYPNVDVDRRIRVRVTPPLPADQGVLYPLFDGFVNDLPVQVGQGGFDYASAALTALDAFEVLGVTPMLSAYDHEVLRSAPTAFYPLAEPAVSQSLASIAPGVAAAGAFAYTGTAGGQYALGANAMLTADPATSLGLTPAMYIDPAGLNPPTLVGGYYVDLSGATAPYLPATGGFTVEMVVALSAVQAGASSLFAQAHFDGTQVFMYENANGVVFTINQVGLIGARIDDGVPHHVAFTLSTDRATMSIYVDGALSAQRTFTAAQTAFTGTAKRQLLGSGFTSSMSGRLSNVAIYTRPLTLAEVNVHYNAMSGFAGEKTGARIDRILTYAGFPASRRTLDVGQTTTGPLLSTAQNALPLLQKVAATEQGFVYIDGSGQLVFLDRARTRNTLSQVTLGAPSMPIETQGLTFSRDKQRIKNRIDAARPNGPTIRVSDPASIAAHHVRSPGTTTYEVLTDAELRDAASWELLLYAQPSIRIPSVTLDPLTAPALWSTVLTRRIGDRITLSNLPAYAPAPSMDFMIQSITHTGRQGPAGEWKVTWALTPPPPNTLRADAAPSPYTRLDSGLKIAY